MRRKEPKLTYEFVGFEEFNEVVEGGVIQLRGSFEAAMIWERVRLVQLLFNSYGINWV